MYYHFDLALWNVKGDSSMAAKQRPLNATAASLLGFLHLGPMTGWDLVATAQQRIGEFWSLTQSQVYRELAAMARDGLIDVGATGSRDRKPYTLTDAGRAAFAQWIDRDPGPETIRFPMLLTLAFGEFLDSSQLSRILAANRSIHQERLDAYLQQSEHEMSVYARATLDFGITYERAVLDWFDRLPEQITQGAG
jgi:DNA-binding PadR family transcriptional regulator